MRWRVHVHEVGFPAAVVVLAVLLMATSVSSYRHNLALIESLATGEGERLFRQLRERRPPGPARLGPPGSSEVLIANQPALESEGVRRVAVHGPAGEILMESGPALGDRLPEGMARIRRPLHGPPRATRTADDVAGTPAELGPPGPPGGHGSPPEGHAGPSEGHAGPPPGWREGPFLGRPEAQGLPSSGPSDGRPTMLVIEYEPRLALDLKRRAWRELATSLAVAAALLVTAWLFDRLRRRASLAEQSLAEKRHLAALGELAAVLAHEIRNPLASLKGHAQLLEEQLAEDPRRHAKAHRVVDEAVRLERLTNSLLDFTRADRLTPGLAAPVEVARRAAELTDPARVIVDATGAPERWHLDAMRIEQALINLVRNALQVSAAPAVVELKVADDGEGLRFSVADRGPGVPSEMRPRVFEPFVTGRAEGTGLGLAVVRQVALLHGGRVAIERRHGGGSVFVLWLPPGPREGD